MSNYSVALDHFELTHSGNPPKPYCQFGFVVSNDTGQFFLGLQFVGGRRFVYPFEPFASVAEVVASMAQYASASWATSPTGPEYDARRFGPGRYEKMQS